MKISHRPIFDVDTITAHYTKKDGVLVKYVCTSAVQQHSEFAADIYYRDTPHPEFGNRYFGLYPRNEDCVMICNADMIEKYHFCMVKVKKKWHYSQHRWDYLVINDTVAIDGGRSYVSLAGDLSKIPVKTFCIKNGEFVHATT
jgi:hypothetical protein